MKCKFCNSDMKSRYVDFIKREMVYCDNHKPVKVHFKSSLGGGNRWIISNNTNYRLVYFNNQTILQKRHPEMTSSPKDYFELIKKFDFDLEILPEEFDHKLKTILTFI